MRKQNLGMQKRELQMGNHLRDCLCEGLFLGPPHHPTLHSSDLDSQHPSPNRRRIPSIYLPGRVISKPTGLISVSSHHHVYNQLVTFTGWEYGYSRPHFFRPVCCCLCNRVRSVGPGVICNICELDYVTLAKWFPILRNELRRPVFGAVLLGWMDHERESMPALEGT